MSEDRKTPSSRAGDGVIPLASGLLLFAPIALLGNELGAALRYPEVGAAVLFPPYAALTAALLASRRRDWGWYILVGFVAHLVTSWPRWTLSWVVFADVANIARAGSATLLLLGLFGGPPRLDSVRRLTAFVVSAAILAPAVGATVGAADVSLHDASPYWTAWRAWFMSNALTGLTILPAFVLAVSERARFRPSRVTSSCVGEASLLGIALAVSCVFAFLIPNVGRSHLVLFFYAPLPVLIWAALRFGSLGASLCLTGVTLFALWGADRQTGPFFAASPDQNILLLQLFVLLTTIPVFCIAAVNAARNAVGHLHRALLVSLHDHVALIDADGVVLEINDSWRRFATSPGVAPFRAVLVGDDYLAAVRAAAEQGDVTAARVFAGVTSVLKREFRRFEMEYDDDLNGRHAGGRYALSIEALERSEGGAVVTRSDVTARRLAQLEIEEQRREVSHLARVAALGQLSGALAHELNQPLSSICNNAEAARHLLRRQPADLHEIDMILGEIVSEDQRAAQVIRRLRALLKRGDTRLQLIDPRELVNEVLELAHAELLARNVAATAHVAPNLPAVLGDRVQLQQVLLNLVLNACEAMAATADGDRRLVLGVRVDERSYVQFSLRDQGTGIAPELVERLFEPFVTTKPDGLGLGLSISRTIVAAHGGRLWAENNAEGGATVYCQLAPAGVGAMTERPNGGSLLGGDAPALRTIRDRERERAEDALTRQVAW